MELYLLRHAEAGEAARDAERELTDHGRAQARAVAAGIAWLEPSIDAIISSPLPRAVQTAQPVADALALPLQTDTALATGQQPEAALALLARVGERVLLVGHEPQLSGIVQAVTGGRIRMRKAMLACLDVQIVEPASGELAWLLAWKHLARLGRAVGDGTTWTRARAEGTPD